MESETELFDSFAMFYYINGRLPHTDGHLFVPDGETPPFLAAVFLLEKNFLMELYKNLTVEVLSSGSSV